MSVRTEASPQRRLHALLRGALADPLAELPLLPLNKAEWQRIDALYRPLLQDLLERAQAACTIEEVDTLRRIAAGLIEQRQVELDELRRYLDPPARHEPVGADSPLMGGEVARALTPVLEQAAEQGAHPADLLWQPVTFIGLAHLQPWLAQFADLLNQPDGQMALAGTLGFSFAASHTSHHELAQRLLLVALLRQLECGRTLLSPITARYRPPWDVWAPDAGVVASVQADLRPSSLAAFGSILLWSRFVVAGHGRGYLVTSAGLQPLEREVWLGDELAREQSARHGWQETLAKSARPRPGRRMVARARTAVAAAHVAFGRLLSAAPPYLPALPASRRS